MSDMHILTGDGTHFRVVMHFAVPAGNNKAGIARSTALVNSGLGGTTVLPDGDGTGGTIDTAPGGEKEDIENGTVFEHSAPLLIESSGDSVVKVRGALRNFYAKEKKRVQNELQRKLKWFGAVESSV